MPSTVLLSNRSPFRTHYTLRHEHGTLHASTPYEQERHFIDIDDIRISESHWGRGIGGLLLRSVCRGITEIDVTEFEYAEVSTFNPRMLRVVDKVFGSAAKIYTSDIDRSADMEQITVEAGLEICRNDFQIVSELNAASREIPDDMDPGVYARVDLAQVDMSTWELPDLT